MSFPGFPNTTPRLLREPTESEQDQARALVANRHVDTRESDYRIALATMVNMSAAFEAQSGVAEAKEAARLHWQNRRSAAR